MMETGSMELQSISGKGNGGIDAESDDLGGSDPFVLALAEFEIGAAGHGTAETVPHGRLETPV